MRKAINIGTDLFSVQAEGAFWCDTGKFTQWTELPCSAFDTPKCPDKMLEFRTFIEWNGSSPFVVRFSAGCRFRLLVNGIFADDGPVEIGGDYGKTDAPDWWFFDTRDLSRFLAAGRNEIRFELLPAGLTQTDYTLGFGWLWCQRQEGNTWQNLEADLWEFRENTAYINRGYLDSRWESCGKWTHCCVPVTVNVPIYKLDIPPLINRKNTEFQLLFPFGRADNIKTKSKTVKIAPGNPTVFYLAFPQEICGHLEIKCIGGHSIAVKMEFEEQYGVPAYPAETWVTGNTGGEFRTVQMYAFRYVRLTVTPSDFLTPDNAESIQLRFSAYERHFPVGKISSLPQKSSNLSKIDDICIRNLILCMQRLHLDSPVHQEGLGCIGDYRIAALIEYEVFRETRLAKADIIRIGFLLRQQKRLFHTAYELCFVLMLREYMSFSGDYKTVHEFYDVLQVIFHRFKGFTGTTGLLSEADNYLFIDWKCDGGYTYHHPSASRGTGALSALWYGALNALADIAGTLDHAPDVEMFTREAEQVRQAFNHELWDAESEVYFDGIPGLSQRQPNGLLPADDNVYSAVSLTSIMALAYGLPEIEQQPVKLLERIIRGELPLRPSVYYMEYLFEAVDRYGLWDKYGKKLILQWQVFEKTGIREGWRAGDYSHAWGSSPAYWMRRAGCKIR